MSTGISEDQDAADMERLAAGHDTALDGLMERHGERLFQYLIRLLQNENDAADAAQGRLNDSVSFGRSLLLHKFRNSEFFEEF
jgi:class 3 adenylate cyclase